VVGHPCACFRRQAGTKHPTLHSGILHFDLDLTSCLGLTSTSYDDSPQSQVQHTTYLQQFSSLETAAMSGAPHPDELEVEQTEGFKLGEKKTIAEYQNLGMYSLSYSG